MEKLISFLKKLFAEKFFGSVTIKFEHGKVTHVMVETKKTWRFTDLPTSCEK